MISKDRILSMLKKIYKFFMTPLAIVEKKRKYQGLNGILFSENMTKKSDFFYQYTRIKKKGEIFPEDSRLDYSEYAIVVQGPVVHEDDFTWETIEIYQRYFPKVKIILSTWVSEDATFIEKAKRLGVICVLSKFPVDRGAGNLNCQIVSSKAGVDAAKAQGCKYVAKTRTDQRYSHPQWLPYVKSLLEAFPVRGDKQKERIVFIDSNGSYKFIAFHVCDFFAFGHVDDLCNYYDIPLDVREYDYVRRYKKEIRAFKAKCIPYEMGMENAELKYDEIGNELLSLQITEFYLMYSYVSKHIYKELQPENLLKSYYECLRTYFCVADAEQMQFYWPKYRRRYEQLSKTERDGKLDFGAWLRIYMS